MMITTEMSDKNAILAFRWSYLWLILAIVCAFPVAPFLWVCGLKILYDKQSYDLRFRGSRWIILSCLLIFWPIGIILLLDRLQIEIGSQVFELEYCGSTFWSVFWIVTFFPVFIVLQEKNGFQLFERRPVTAK